jgi:hypothetical protein
VRGQRHAPAALYPGKDPVPIVQEVGWTPGPVWTGEENLAPTGIRSPDRPARSSVAISTELPGPLHSENCSANTGVIGAFKEGATGLQLPIRKKYYKTEIL